MDSPVAPAVFISYASQDEAIAQRLCAALRAADVEVWFDKNELRGGDAWDQNIRRQIRDCTLFIPIISAHTQARREGYFRLEWKLADERTHLMAEGTPFLLPVAADEMKERDALVPKSFLHVQWTRLPPNAVPTEFAERVRTLLVGEAPATSRPPSVPPAPEPNARLRRRSTPRWAWVAIALTFAAASFFWWRGGRPSAAAEKSVAVLAFKNQSDDKDNEYFSDGISDELLNVLSKVPGLRVAAQSSSFSFKGRNATAQEIGAKLNVAHLVEGSVRKSGSRVKISVRLSRAASGEQLWSESYERELKEIFAVQEEIARTVVQALRGPLLGEADVRAASRGRTTNVEAYRLYLQGRHFETRFSEEGERLAIGYFREAVKLDPNFALAWAELGRAYMMQAAWIGGISFQEGFREARVAAERALALEPDSVEALIALFGVQTWCDLDWGRADATIERALTLAPDNATVASYASLLSLYLDRPEKALAHGKKSIALDPIDAEASINLAFSYLWFDRLEEAAQEAKRAGQLNPEMTWAFSLLSTSRLLQRRFDEAQVAAEKEASGYARQTSLALAHFARGRRAESDAVLRTLIEQYEQSASYQIAWVYAYRGENDRAFEWLDKVNARRDSGRVLARRDPFFRGLHSDPRWPKFLTTLGLDDESIPRAKPAK